MKLVNYKDFSKSSIIFDWEFNEMIAYILHKIFDTGANIPAFRAIHNDRNYKNSYDIPF